MLLNIKQFILLIIFLLLGVLYSIFSDYYLDQREQTASVILGTLQDDMSEISYVLSKNITEKQNIQSSRAFLDRAASNNDFIKAIIILDDEEVLLTTDPHYRKAITKSPLYNHHAKSAYEQLTQKVGLEGIVRFYEGEHLKKLSLLFLLDQDEIEYSLSYNKTKFFTYFGILPALSIFLIWIILKLFIGNPLEKLRQYAYYQSFIPKAFKVKELEAIRSSMVQTFTRLDAEQKELYKMARTDSLSGLANRNALNEHLKRLIANASRTNKEFAYLFLDLDNFKTVNDALGHHIGDELLQNVASTIAEVLRANDFVARVGGDEFVIVLEEYHSMSELTNIIERIQNRLSITWVVQTHPINITSSVGIAFYPKDGTDIISLMQHSDIAMYEAKKKGRAQYHFFTERLNAEVKKSIAMDKAMRRALEHEEYQLYYQPKIDMKTGEIVGAEALIRWQTRTDGIIPPNDFIPLAEENGFIVELGLWVMREAMYQQKAWQAKGIDISIAINVATQQLLDDNFEKKFKALLEETQVDPAKIEFEITEYLFLDQTNNNLNTLNMIHDNGISISLDDFGTGYSSLSYLKKFPIDSIKIDKTFVDDFNTTEGAIFLETIVKMGQTLDMDVIAEGVETREQSLYLKQVGCKLCQGYYCSKPLPVTDFEGFYKTHQADVCKIANWND
ncbi:EAL domain-containing protein [Thiomicrorhabdus sp. ZW0627]|uniref:putative bifunctional diguanylate cyclase/phosphodiesterase n=1 Tax=Thiomicrorhabdus sp. ZW0627 TaxID=3039774 RepID=UPI0024368BC9|nr:EAL domain-containing protein [Thiomicrorhabdus sp. ZW0627]MDG6772711.1 EAL domain-containing protein [Thiomicrorhabdus sp. ZW0627]